MYSFDTISKAEHLTRLPSGEVQCGHRHVTGGTWSYREQQRPAATTAWLDGRGFIFACKQHTGTIKSAVTRGSYSGRDVVNPLDYGMDMGTIVADPEAALKVLQQKIADEKNEAQRRSDIAMRIYQQRNWQERRDEYDANDEVTFEPFGTPDDYGRTFVNLRIGKNSYSAVHVALTPAQVRKIVEHAPLWAQNAERLTHDARPPVVTDEERRFMHIGDEPECDDCHRSDGTHAEDVEH